MTDEIEWVRSIRPEVDGPDPVRVARERSALMATINATRPSTDEPITTTTPASQRTRRPRRWLAATAVIATGAVAAAGWAVTQRDADDTAAFMCQGRGAMVVLPNDGTPPIDACRSVWAQGSIDPDARSAPPLVACVASTGTVVVIAETGDDTCATNGMSRWKDEADFTAVGAAIRDAKIDLHDRMATTGSGCASVADWRSRIMPSLNAAGVDGWTITSDRIEPDRNCFGVASIKPASRTIELIGVPGDHSIDCDPRTGC